MTTIYWFDEPPFSMYADFNPVPAVTNFDQGHTVTQLPPSQSLRFRSASTSVGIHSRVTYLSTRTYRLYHDGVEIGTTILSDPSDTWKTVVLATELSGEHEYEICCCIPIYGARGNWFDGGVVLDTGTFVNVGHPARDVVFSYGDSTGGALSNCHLTDTSSPIVIDCKYSHLFIGCRAAGKQMYVEPAAGGRVYTTGRDNTGNLPAGGSAVFVQFMRNDVPYLPEDQSNCTSAYTTMVAGIRSVVGAGKWIFCLQPFEVVGSTSQRSLFAMIIQDAIAGMPFVKYVPTDGWCAVNNLYIPDNTHHNTWGEAQLAPFFTSLLVDGSTKKMTANSATATNVTIERLT